MTPHVRRPASFRSSIPGTLVVAAAFTLTAPHNAKGQGPSLKVFTTRAIRTVLDQVGPEFEQRSGYRLEIVTDIAAPMVRRVRGGEPFDVLVAAPDQIDALVRDGFISAETRTELARSGIGVAVRQGAPVPDVGSVDSFANTLLNASSIAFLREGQSGVYLARLLDSLSVSAAIQHKVVRPDQDIVSQLVAQGEVEIGMVVLTQILTTPGVTLAGPLPDEIQNHVIFVAGVSRQSRVAQAANELLAFLTTPAAHAVMQAQGMQPTAPTR